MWRHEVFDDLPFCACVCFHLRVFRWHRAALFVERLERDPIEGHPLVCPRVRTLDVLERMRRDPALPWDEGRTYAKAMQLLKEHTAPGAPIEGVRDGFTRQSFRRGFAQLLVRLQVPAKDAMLKIGWESVEAYENYIFEAPSVLGIGSRMRALIEAGPEGLPLELRRPAPVLPAAQDAPAGVRALSRRAVARPPVVAESSVSSSEDGGSDDDGSSSSLDPEQYAGRFDVQKIVAEKVIRPRGLPPARLVRVRWVGYRADDDTWEPIEEILSSRDRDKVVAFYGGEEHLPEAL